MFSTLVRRAAATSRPPIFNIHTNTFKAKKPWPPDFEKLSPKHQFRLERRYRRRAKLKWARPRWTKFVKMATWGTSIFILVYGVLFMDWGREETPFKSVRGWFFGSLDNIWTTNQQRPRPSSRTENPKQTAAESR